MNRILLAVNIIIFTVYWLSSNNILLDTKFAIDIEDKFVMIPQDILQGRMLYTLFTSMFMHATWYHLLGNMLFLYIFGDNIEDAFGHVGYLMFYLFSGLAAAFTHIASMLFAPTVNSMFGLAITSDLTSGVVGASGAISGVLGAYMVLYPKAKIVTLIFYFILPVPAIILLGVWFALQWMYGIFDVSGGVAYFAHIGGFVAGIILALTVGRKGKKAREKRTKL
jgi:membrane associated rhomboid family serine protease